MLIKNIKNITKFVELIKKIPNNIENIPFVNLEEKNQKKKMIKIVEINKKEIESFNFSISYFSRWNIVKKNEKIIPFIEIYKKETLKTLINHFKDYPLLGEKANSFHKWEVNL